MTLQPLPSECPLYIRKIFISFLSGNACGTMNFMPLLAHVPGKVWLALTEWGTDPGSKRFPDPGSESVSKSILTQKIVSKLSKIWSAMFIPDPDHGSGSWFFTILDPGIKKGSGSLIRIRNTGKIYTVCFRYCAGAAEPEGAGELPPGLLRPDGGLPEGAPVQAGPSGRVGQELESLKDNLN